MRQIRNRSFSLFSSFLAPMVKERAHPAVSLRAGLLRYICQTLSSRTTTAGGGITRHHLPLLCGPPAGPRRHDTANARQSPAAKASLTVMEPPSGMDSDVDDIYLNEHLGDYGYLNF